MRERVRLIPVGVAAAALLVACSAGASTPAPTQPTTSLTSATPIGTSATTPPPAGTLSGLDCRLAVVAPSGLVVRWEAPVRSRWWVAYATVENTCDVEITLQELDNASVPTAQEVDVSLGDAWTEPPDPTVPPMHLEPAMARTKGMPLAGHVMRPHERVVVLVTVTVGQEPGPQPMPDLTLHYRWPNGFGQSALPGKLSFCTCAARSPSQRSALTRAGLEPIDAELG